MVSSLRPIPSPGAVALQHLDLPYLEPFPGLETGRRHLRAADRDRADGSQPRVSDQIIMLQRGLRNTIIAGCDAVKHGPGAMDAPHEVPVRRAAAEDRFKLHRVQTEIHGGRELFVDHLPKVLEAAPAAHARIYRTIGPQCLSARAAQKPV